MVRERVPHAITGEEGGAGHATIEVEARIMQDSEETEREWVGPEAGTALG